MAAFGCPQCGASTGEVDPSHLGTVIRCAACGQHFHLPAPHPRPVPPAANAQLEWPERNPVAAAAMVAMVLVWFTGWYKPWGWLLCVIGLFLGVFGVIVGRRGRGGMTVALIAAAFCAAILLLSVIIDMRVEAVKDSIRALR